MNQNVFNSYNKEDELGIKPFFDNDDEKDVEWRYAKTSVGKVCFFSNEDSPVSLRFLYI